MSKRGSRETQGRTGSPAHPIDGYHGGHKAFTRLLVENRVSRMAANDAWMSGRKARENGVGCTCHPCRGPTS
jgi:hypothetical protein